MDEERDQPWNFHTCKFCPYRSKKIFQMCNHVRLHRRRPMTDTFTCDSKTPELFECEICEFETTLKVNLSEHCRILHEEKDANGQIENILKCYRCQGCGFATHSVIVIAKHVNKCDGAFNRKQEETQKEKKSAANLRTTVSHSDTFVCSATLEKLQCDFCDFKTDLSVNLIEHCRVLHEQKEANEEVENILKCYSCKSCGLVTYSVIVLSKHVNDRNHLVLETSNKTLESVQKKNKDAKLFECNICSLYKTTKKGNLKRHVLVHTHSKEIGQFECAHCGLKFKKKSYLRTHFSVKHGNPKRVKWFECTQCGLKTKYKRCLARHMRKMHKS